MCLRPHPRELAVDLHGDRGGLHAHHCASVATDCTRLPHCKDDVDGVGPPRIPCPGQELRQRCVPLLGICSEDVNFQVMCQGCQRGAQHRRPEPLPPVQVLVAHAPCVPSNVGQQQDEVMDLWIGPSGRQATSVSHERGADQRIPEITQGRKDGGQLRQAVQAAVFSSACPRICFLHCAAGPHNLPQCLHGACQRLTKLRPTP